MDLARGDDGIVRCAWGDSTPDYRVYHDDEWGRPVSDDTRLFEKLCLEGFQSGLSWLTILRKREAFRAAFAGFDFHQVARFTEDDVERLLQDAGSSATAARSRRRSTTPSARSSSPRSGPSPTSSGVMTTRSSSPAT
jgi:DNA-3-methyladenine glycosylase I